jgi:excisionase family DNA binding protein
MKPTPVTAAAVPATAERYLTLRDLCARLQCSRTTAWRLVNERGLRCVRIGGLVRVKESDLAAWIEKHSTAGNGSDVSELQP